MWKKIHSGMLIVIAACCLVLLPEVAMASDLTCNNATPNAGTELFPSSGSNSPCANISPISQHIFSWIICSYVQILDYVLDNMYCSMQYNVTDILTAIFTLYVVLFGLQLLMGTSQLTVKEFMVRCLKISGVWMFVTNATYGVSMAFDFFVAVATEATSWVLNGVMQSPPFTDSSLPGYATLHPIAQAYQNSGGVMPIYQFLDQLVYDAVIGPFTQANNTVTTFFIATMFIFPTIAALMGWYLWENIKIIARALISFMIGITALAFLIALSPVFLSLMLFKITYHFFDNWLKYMISFSLQIVIIFGCVGMWLAVTSYFIGFFNNLSTVIPPSYLLEQLDAPQTIISKTVAVCKYTYNEPQPPQTYLPTLTADPSCNFSDPTNPQGTIQVSDMPAEANTDNPGKGFIVYLTTNLLALLLITYAFSALLKQAPDIARQLAGPEYVPMIGQGMGFSRYGQLKGMSRVREDTGGRGGKKGLDLPASGGWSGVIKQLTGGTSDGSVKQFVGRSMEMIQKR